VPPAHDSRRKAVWIAGGGCAVGITRIDSSTHKAVATLVNHDEVAGVALGMGTLWYTTLQRTLVGRIDPNTNTVQKPITVPGTPTALAVRFGSIWVPTRQSEPSYGSRHMPEHPGRSRYTRSRLSIVQAPLDLTGRWRRTVPGAGRRAAPPLRLVSTAPRWTRAHGKT
jgi:hypothetical protein